MVTITAGDAAMDETAGSLLRVCGLNGLLMAGIIHAAGLQASHRKRDKKNTVRLAKTIVLICNELIAIPSFFSSIPRHFLY